MIIAEQMKDAMQQEEIQLAIERGLRLAGIAGRRLRRDHHVAEQIRLHAAPLAFLHGKRDHVGRAVLAQVITIDRLDAGIIDNQNRQLGVRTSRGA